MGMSRRGERLGWALSRVFKGDELGALRILDTYIPKLIWLSTSPIYCFLSCYDA
jgi:hypothetical protein